MFKRTPVFIKSMRIAIYGYPVLKRYLHRKEYEIKPELFTNVYKKNELAMRNLSLAHHLKDCMSNICIITGSSGLIGSESVEFFSKKFDKIVGVDNNMSALFLRR